MAVHDYQSLVSHAGHTLECVIYGDNENAAIECVDCGVILVDFDNDENDEVEINVFFRKWRDWDGGDFIAIWEDENTSDMLNSYQHIGQHCEAHYDLINELEPATESEYAPLKREMEGRGYTVNVREERNFSIFKK